MTPEQISLVKRSWQQVIPIKDAAAELFYGRLFELNPALRPLFKGDMAAQGRKLMAMIQSAVNGLEHLNDIVPAVQDLGRRHLGYGVKDEDYETVGTALLWTLEQGLGPSFTCQVKDAWAEAYGILAGTMQAAAEEVQTS